MLNVIRYWKYVLLSLLIVTVVTIGTLPKFEMDDLLLGEDTHTYVKSASLANVSVLSDPYYVVQPNAIEELIKKNLTVEKLCHQARRKKVFHYVICPHRSDFISNNIKRDGYYHGGFTEVLLRLLQRTPGAALIDVGAHYGAISLPLMTYLRFDQRQVISVEPDLENIRSLALGIKKNGFSLAEWPIIARAMWDTVDETAQLITPGWSVGFLANRWPTKLTDKQDNPLLMTDERFGKSEVKTATFDTHVLPVALAMRITTAIMKVDIEACECTALRNASELLSTINIPYILTEYLPPAYYLSRGAVFKDNCIKRWLAYMKRFNYHPFDVHIQGERARMNMDNYQNWKECDILWKKIL